MDHQQILNDLIAALKGELGVGYCKIQDFAESQGRLLAKQAEGIAKSRAGGRLAEDNELYAFFLDNLKANSENMAKSLVMLTILTIEQAWNAVAGILWGSIRTILSGAGVPGALLPETPPISL